MIVFVLSALQNAVLPAAEPKAMPEQPAILAALRTISQAGFYFGGIATWTISGAAMAAIVR